MRAHDKKPNYVLTLLNTPDQEAMAEAGRALYQYNVEKTGIADRTPVGATLSDPKSRKVLGGLWGRTELGLLFLDMFLPEFIRGQSEGARLLSAMGGEARRRKLQTSCRGNEQFPGPLTFTNVMAMRSSVASNSACQAMRSSSCAKAWNERQLQR
jgi:hypothetical protein